MDRREKEDMRNLIRLVLDTPIKGRDTVKVDGKLSLESFKGKNTDVKTRIILQIANEAMKGDRPSADFLMKYGGFELPKESNVSVEMPTIINDIGPSKKEGLAKAIDAVIYDDSEESADGRDKTE